jgi:hypothetical protein
VGDWSTGHAWSGSDGSAVPMAGSAGPALMTFVAPRAKANPLVRIQGTRGSDSSTSTSALPWLCEPAIARDPGVRGAANEPSEAIERLAAGIPLADLSAGWAAESPQLDAKDRPSVRPGSSEVVCGACHK